MTLACQYDRVVRILILLLLTSDGSTSSITPRPTATAVVPGSSNGNGTCDFRTINYITDTLPQQCAKSTWGASNATSTRASGTNEEGVGNANATAAELLSDTTAGESQPEPTIVISPTVSAGLLETDAEDAEPGALDEGSFLSFEEWKKQTLDKEKESSTAGKKVGEGKRKDEDGFHNHLDNMDDGELEVDLSSLKAGRKSQDGSQPAEAEAEETQEERKSEEKPKKRDPYLSKDAGKTFKERFSYASFDAGATVLKTHKGAKNARSVLIENKDSYMLSKCSESNKFIIIELSEDIWIDTVVLANYEFFSSMIRTFRVSVSDRYPVALSKWKDIGTYEARNSRDIQAFLIENPQIWARHIRIEFLSHFGNEYYCPLSLVRVHGTRMLESWKLEGSADDEEEVDETEEAPEEDSRVPEAVAEAVKEEEDRLKAATKKVIEASELLAAELVAAVDSNELLENASAEAQTTPWKKPGFYLIDVEDVTEQDNVCHISDAPINNKVVDEVSQAAIVNSSAGVSSEEANLMDNNKAQKLAPATSNSRTESSSTEHASTLLPAAVSMATVTTAISDESSSSSVPSSPPTVSHDKKLDITSTPVHRNKTSTSTSSAPSSLPTIQESFFKAVSRRLSLLESNSTLSLAYISEQSKLLREAFTKVEKKQLQKTSEFLDTLNTTVLAELRMFRQQYDEIWQSTVISLESQREESRRELLAVTERLGILGEEVVWQRRMSIVQSVLLLSCLALVIFSRVSSAESFSFHTPRPRPSNGLESPSEGEWPEHDGMILEDDDNDPSHDNSGSPPTSYERDLTPPSEEIDDGDPDSSHPDVHDGSLRRSKSNSSDTYEAANLSPLPTKSMTIESALPKAEHYSPALSPTKKKRKNSLGRKRKLSQSSNTPPLSMYSSSTTNSNLYNVLGSSPTGSRRDKSVGSQLRTPEGTPDPEYPVKNEEVDGGGGGAVPSSTQGLSIAGKPLPDLPS